ncbi:MAG: FAD-linked oxidase C-terminal domain-containing protein [Solirubrobacteraceae bacterium]
MTAVPENVAAAGGERTILFGHLGDGNVHVNVLGPAPDDVRVDNDVLELALEYGATISSEHGIGVEKVHWLEPARGVIEVAAMRAVNDALDPPPAQSREGSPKRAQISGVMFSSVGTPSRALP